MRASARARAERCGSPPSTWTAPPTPTTARCCRCANSSAAGTACCGPHCIDEDELLSGTPRFDVFLMHHFFREQELELVRRLAGEGVAVVWDKDDDISATPTAGARLQGIRRPPRRQARLRSQRRAGGEREPDDDPERAPRRSLPGAGRRARRGDREPRRARGPRARAAAPPGRRDRHHGGGGARRRLQGASHRPHPAAPAQSARGRARRDDRVGSRPAAEPPRPPRVRADRRSRHGGARVRHRPRAARRHGLQPRALEREAEGVRGSRSDVARLAGRSVRGDGRVRRAGSWSRTATGMRRSSATCSTSAPARSLAERARAWAQQQSADRTAGQWESAIVQAVARTRAS